MNVKERNIKLFVGNLPFDAVEDDIRVFLHGCGQIRYLSIRRDPHTNRSRGYAHLEYRTEPECIEAFKRLLGKEIRGRPIKIDFCDDVYRKKYPELTSDSIFVKDKPTSVNPDNRKFQGPVVPPPPPQIPIIPITQPNIGIPITQPIPIPQTIPVPPIIPTPPVPPSLVTLSPLSGLNPLTGIPNPPPIPNLTGLVNLPVTHSVPIVPELTVEPKRPRSDIELLIDNGKIVNNDLFYIIKNMSMLDVFKLVKKIDNLMEKSPNTARSILNSNHSMRSALIHAKLLLGYKDLKFSNLTTANHTHIFDYFLTKFRPTKFINTSISEKFPFYCAFRSLTSAQELDLGIEKLHDFVTRDGFVVDDKVLEWSKNLDFKQEIIDYETLLKSVEIFYKLNEPESISEILNHFSKDIHYIPTEILTQLTKFCFRKLNNSEITLKLQSELYSRIVDFGLKPDINTVESLLYCTNLIKDYSIVYQTLESVMECKNIINYGSLFKVLKLYHFYLSSNNSIEGFMDNIIITLKQLNHDSGKNLVNCLRYLLKIRNYVDFDLDKISSVFVDEYNLKDLVLILRDIHNSDYLIPKSIYSPIIRSSFSMLTELPKDSVVSMLKFLSKHEVKLIEDQKDLLNLNLRIHLNTCNFTTSDVLNTLSYYSNPNYTHPHTVNKLYTYFINKMSKEKDEISDINFEIYVLSKFVLYFNDQNKLNNLTIKRYLRVINWNYLALTDRCISYCFYVLYKIDRNPLRLVQKLLPILNSNKDRYKPIDLVQLLLFFTRFRNQHFFPVLVSRVQQKILDQEFSPKQLVIVCKCLYNYKKIFVSNLFTQVNSKINQMAPSQVCTIFNLYTKTKLNNKVLIKNLNEIISNNLNNLNYKDFVRLLLPIKRAYINDKLVIDEVKRQNLEPWHYFDVFDEVPEPDLDDDQIIKCILSLSQKNRSEEFDKFARFLYEKMFKIVPKLSKSQVSSLLASIHSYGYTKPKINRLLTSALKKTSVSQESKNVKGEDINSQIFRFFRHISKGPPHLDKIHSN
uniref:RNA-binding protein, putative n=1 Tax=Theileria annulata TaxID=5874 RepID=A0A3B0MFF5_THEAN